MFWKTSGFALALFFLLVSGAAAQTQYLPQVANGNFGNVIYRTTFILFNNSDTAVSSILTLTDDAGNPMKVSIDGFGTSSQFSIDLPPGSTGFLQTDGVRPGAVGAATLTSTMPVGFSAFYTVYELSGKFKTQSGVEPSSLMTDFMLPADNIGSYETGLALFSPTAGASVTLTLLNPDGSQLMSQQISLVAGGHSAAYLAGAGGFFPNLASFRGTLLVRSSSPISALGLRQFSDPQVLCYTSLPVVPLTSTEVSVNLAQVANGIVGSIGYKTAFRVFNISSSPANVALALTKDDGSALSLTLSGMGSGPATGSNFNFNLAAGGSVFLETDGAGPGLSGAAIVTSSAPIGASAIFTVLDSHGNFQTEAGVGDSPAFSSLTIPVELDSNTNTGVALFNPSNTLTTLTINLLDANGVLVNTTSYPLGPKNHHAVFVDMFFPGLGSMKGSMAISPSLNGGVASTILRQFGPPSAINYTGFVPSAGTATGKAQISGVLLSKEETGINAIAGDPDVSWAEVLPQGTILSGTLSGAGPGMEVIANAGGGRTYAGSVNPLTGYYFVVLPPATYTLSAVYLPNGSPSASTLVLTYNDPNPVIVTAGGTVRNMILPEPTLVDVSGTVSGNLPLAGSQIVFTSSDMKIQGLFYLDAGGNYAGQLPSGSYSVSTSFVPIPVNVPPTVENLSLFNIGSLTVGTTAATANYAIPSTVNLSGKVSGGGVFGIQSGSFIQATDSSVPSVPTGACCAPPATSFATIDPTGAYQMALGKNRSFVIGVTSPINMGTGLVAEIEYPASGTTVNLGADTTLNFNVPSPPGRAVIFGVVKDTTGQGVPNVTVTASSQSLTGTPGLGFRVSGITNMYGNYSLLVLSGNYRLSFVPLPPY